MRKKSEPVVRVNVRIIKTADNYYLIQKHQNGFSWTTYPFRYNTENEARHDMKKIMKSLEVRGFKPVEEEVEAE